MTDLDERALALLPEHAWEDSLTQDGSIQGGYHITELTGLNRREGWPEGMRLIARRVRPSRRQLAKLTAFERQTGWRYSVTATNIRHLWGIAGSHQPQWLDVLHRSHATVEDRVRTDKAMGLGNLPSQDWTVNRGWMLTSNLAHDLDCWIRLLALHDHPALERAEPDTMRLRIYHVPAHLAAHARRHRLGIDRTWPWARRWSPPGSGSPASRPSPDDRSPPRHELGRSTSRHPGPWNPAHPRRHATAHPKRHGDITGTLPTRSAPDHR